MPWAAVLRSHQLDTGTRLPLGTVAASNAEHSVRSTTDGAQVISASGELDLDSGPTLEEALTLALQVNPPPGVIALDLSALTFSDSSGLNLLLRIRMQAQQRAIPLRLAGLRPSVLRVFEFTGADALFSLHDRIDQALA
jgi:anti-anti-sigma factor